MIRALMKVRDFGTLLFFRRAHAELKATGQVLGVSVSDRHSWEMVLRFLNENERWKVVFDFECSTRQRFNRERTEVEKVYDFEYSICTRQRFNLVEKYLTVGVSVS